MSKLAPLRSALFGFELEAAFRSYIVGIGVAIQLKRKERERSLREDSEKDDLEFAGLQKYLQPPADEDISELSESESDNEQFYKDLESFHKLSMDEGLELDGVDLDIDVDDDILAPEACVPCEGSVAAPLAIAIATAVAAAVAIALWAHFKPHRHLKLESEGSLSSPCQSPSAR